MKLSAETRILQGRRKVTDVEKRNIYIFMVHFQLENVATQADWR